MRRREFIALLGCAAFPWSANAQSNEKVRRIGILHVLPPEASTGYQAFRERLRELGYVEGQNVRLEYRWAPADSERLHSLAAELTAANIDVLVAGDRSSTDVAKDTTKDIPIVAAVLTLDPVATGLVASLAHPGGNITGISLFGAEMSSKRVELLREIVPSLLRVAVLWSAHNAYHPVLLDETQQAARRFDITVVRVEISSGIEAALQTAVNEGAGAVIALQSAEFSRFRSEIAALGLKYRLPIMTGEDGFAQLGGLIKYGPSTSENWRLAARYVDRILKGIKPADLPVEQPTRFELIVNLRTAKALGLTIPESILLRADEVIE
jgi:putative tryptophan/tyrosine transport system substrate-binding protein